MGADDLDGRCEPDRASRLRLGGPQLPHLLATYLDGELGPAVLAKLTARVDAAVDGGNEHVVVAWPIDAVDRKRHAGAAVLSRNGEPLAVARALIIEPRAG
jgi:hypothetical protein